MPLKLNSAMLLYTAFLVYVLSETLSGRTVLASHHMQQIAFTMTRHGYYEIYFMDADGGNQKRFTRNKVHDWGANLVSRRSEDSILVAGYCR